MIGLIEWSVYASYFSVIVLMSCLLARKENFRVKHLQILAVLLAVSALSDIIGFVLIKNGASNAVVGNIYTVLEFVLLSLMYWQLHTPSNLSLIKILSIVFALGFLVNTIFFQSLLVPQNITLSLSSLILGIISLRFFKVTHQLPVNTKGKDSNFNSLFCINVAVFLYFSLNFWVFTISPPMMEFFNEQGAINPWAFHNAGNILKNLLLALGIYWAGVKG